MLIPTTLDSPKSHGDYQKCCNELIDLLNPSHTYTSLWANHVSSCKMEVMTMHVPSHFVLAIKWENACLLTL